ncbi:aminopeptidase N [Trueperella sp. LYQ141]|uniref:aminopeptidase N n=1 Tax=Trueperella sp. LYQ141 TaxID=3391058 RepID=UPI00398317D9
MPAENLTRSEAAERADLLQTEKYYVALDLTGDTTFRSQTTVTFTATAGADTFIDLIAQSVEQITLNGVELPVSAFADSRVALSNLAEHNELYIDATCEYSHTGEGLHRAIDPADNEVYLYSQFEVADARRVFAVFEQPDLKAEFTFDITAPARWKVFSVSPTPEPTRDGEYARWVFTPTERISPYLTCIIAGPYLGDTGNYTSVDGRDIPMGVYCRASVYEHLDAQEIIDITIAGMVFYEKEFDVPYPFRKYDQIFVPEFNAGAMEHPGCVTILDDYVFVSRPTEAIVERRAITVLHELAHMWFGDLVTMKWWDDLWLNESFAEFMSHVATANATRWTNAWVTFNASEKVGAQQQDQLPSTHPIAADIRDLEDVLVNFDQITYGKGASVFQQLVAYVGYHAFMSGVSKYLKKMAWSNATLRDLLVELEAASGRDLRTWSALWLEEAGINTLTPRIETDGTRITRFAIEQSCDEHASLRPHRIAIGGYSLREGKLVRVLHSELDIDGELSDVPDFAGAERPDVILINDGDLAYAKVRLDEESAAVARDHINDFSDRLTRTLVLDSMWDMCRDGELPARDFIALALNALRTEDHGTVLRYLLAELTLAARLYTAPEYRQEAEQLVGTSLFELLANCEPESDRQLQIGMSAVSFATAQSDLDRIHNWLSGHDVPPGLMIDAEFRWVILRRLAAVGRITEEDIATEKNERDNTSSGAASAARARAALSDPASKETVWRDIIAGEMPNSIHRSLCLGFTDGDAELLVAFVDRYFGALVEQWEDRTVEFASSFIRHTFPTQLTGMDVCVDIVERTQNWLEEHSDAAPALRRLVSENLSRAQRAQHAQRCDTQAARHDQ